MASGYSESPTSRQSAGWRVVLVAFCGVLVVVVLTGVYILLSSRGKFEIPVFLETNSADHWLAILPFGTNHDQRQFLLPAEVRFLDQSTTTTQWMHVQRHNKSLYLDLHFSGEINRLGVVVLHWVDRGVGEPWKSDIAPDTIYIIDAKDYGYPTDGCPSLADLDLEPNSTGITRTFFLKPDTKRK